MDDLEKSFAYKWLRAYLTPHSRSAGGSHRRIKSCCCGR